MAKYSDRFIQMAKAVEAQNHAIYDLTFEDATKNLVKEVSQILGITKTDAKCAVLNALVYNCVQDEIIGQIKWLLGIEEVEDGNID